MPKRNQAVVWVTAPVKAYVNPYGPGKLVTFADNMMGALDRIERAGLVVNNIEAGLGRIIVLPAGSQSMPAKLLDTEWMAVAKMNAKFVKQYKGEKTNPRSRGRH